MLNELIKDELFEIEEMQNDEQKERFKVTDIDGANWTFRKLRAIQEKENEIKDLMDKEIKRIQEWAKQEIESTNKTKQFFEHLLREYFEEQKALDPKFKVSTPYGKVTSRKQQPKWDYDDATVLESLKQHKLNDFIRIKEEVNKADLKKEVEIFEDVFAFDSEVVCRIIYLDVDGVEFANIETGEIYNWNNKSIEYYSQLTIHDGKIINGINVESQPDSITIKVVE